MITFVLRYAWTSHKDGYLSAFYFIWYGIVRLCLEPLRSAEFQMSVSTDGIPTSMIMSALYVVGGIIVILLVNYNEKKKDMYGVIEAPKEVLKKNILTLSIANAYYKMRTTKYLQTLLRRRVGKDGRSKPIGKRAILRQGGKMQKRHRVHPLRRRDQAVILHGEEISCGRESVCKGCQR